MCSRVASNIDKNNIKRLFDVRYIRDIVRGYNIGGGMKVNVILKDKGERILDTMLWGFDIQGKLVINARVETIRERVSFRRAFLYGRCLVVVNGFYEWDRKGKPLYIYRKDNIPFLLGGISNNDRCVIITTPANTFIKPHHHRMPLIIDRENIDLWLFGDNIPDGILLPYNDNILNKHYVNPRVEDISFDLPECIKPMSLF